MNVRWWKAASIRAIKTAAQTVAAQIAVGMLPASATIVDVDWKVVLGTAALAAVASFFTSLAGLPEVEEE